MNIAGYNFIKVTGTSFYSGSGIFIYLHQATGKCFVRALRNCKVQRGKNNYPNYLKELLKVNSSEVVLFFAEITKDTKEAVFLASRAVVAGLSEIGKLYKRPKPNRGGIYRQLNGEELQRYTVWSMMHRGTGAVFYFEELANTDVTDKVKQRLRTFNNYVAKGITNSNRVLHYFTKQHFPLLLDDWVIRDLEMQLVSEQKALLHITKLSKNHLESNEVVLNRICNTDSLYYRNALLKLKHVSLEEYLQHTPA